MPTAIEQVPLRTIDGSAATLGDYANKVRLVVNVASQCGLTPQYTALEAVYQRFHDRGFEVLAFPANEFGAQEPGTAEEIKEFCSSKYDVSFPLFAKIVVKGEGQHPLYEKLTAEKPTATNLPGSDFEKKLNGYGVVKEKPSDILWNFEKFLVGRDGKVIERFAPDVSPDAPALLAAIESAL